MARILKRVPQGKIGRGEIRRLFDYPPETVDGLVAMAARLVNNSQIIVGVGKRGIQRQRLFIATHGAVGIIPGHMYVSQIIDKFRRFRPEFHRFLDKLQRGFRIPFLLMEHPQPVQGIGMAGIAFQNTTVKGFRLGQTSRLMMGGGLRHQGGDILG